MYILDPACINFTTYFVDSKAQCKSGTNHYLIDKPTDNILNDSNYASEKQRDILN